MCGSATFTMVASRTIMSWAAAITTSARPSRRGTWLARIHGRRVGLRVVLGDDVLRRGEFFGHGTTPGEGECGQF